MDKDRLIELAIYGFLWALMLPLALMALAIVWGLFIGMVGSFL